MLTPENTLAQRRFTIGEHLELIDYSGEIIAKDERIADVELERDTLMVWFRHALHALADLTTRNRQLQRRNRTLSDEVILWRDRALGRSPSGDKHQIANDRRAA